MKKSAIVLGLIVLMSACKDDDTDALIARYPEAVVNLNTNQGALSQRFATRNEPVSIIGANGGRVTSDQIEMTLVSEVTPPVVDGKSIMASTISIQEGIITVGYNFAGSVFKGGVDIIAKAEASLSLVSQMELEQADVSMVSFSGDQLYYAGGSPGVDSVAFVDKVSVSGGVPDMESFDRIRLGGNVATSVAMANGYLFVTTGASTENGGGLYVIDAQTHELERYVAIKDARWVHADETSLSVLSANPGRLSILNPASFSIERTVAISGLDQEGHKSTFDIEGNNVYVASGYKGIQVYDLTNGAFLLNIPLPSGTSDLYANSVTINNQVGYVAAGESVYLFEMQYGDDSITAEVIGQLALGDFQSINEVQYSNGFLAVAAGLGGTKLIRVTPPSETVPIHNFDEPGNPFWWQTPRDTVGVEINEYVAVEGRGKVIHMKGYNKDGHPQIASRYTGFAGKVSAKMEGYDPKDVYINFDLKGDGRNTRVLFMIQGRDVNGEWKAWSTNLYGTNPEWERHSFNLGHMNVAGLPTIHRVQSIYFIVYSGTDPEVDVMIDDLTYSTYAPD
ncbi:MAG: hypothetical protein AAGA66_20615 [Bacteroidota bacterium]